MMKRNFGSLIAIAAVLLFSGCGNVDIHSIPLAEIHERFGNYWAFTTWDDYGCNIYMPYRDEVPEPVDEHYDAILQHERKHCTEKYWHDEELRPKTDPFCNGCHFY